MWCIVALPGGLVFAFFFDIYRWGLGFGVIAILDPQTKLNDIMFCFFWLIYCLSYILCSDFWLWLFGLIFSGLFFPCKKPKCKGFWVYFHFLDFEYMKISPCKSSQTIRKCFLFSFLYFDYESVTLFSFENNISLFSLLSIQTFGKRKQNENNVTFS